MSHPQAILLSQQPGQLAICSETAALSSPETIFLLSSVASHVSENIALVDAWSASFSSAVLGIFVKRLLLV